MSTLDSLVTSDLAALAADNRRETRTLAESLRAIGIGAAPIANSGALDRSLASLTSLTSLLGLANVYARRFAQIVAGTIALATALALLATALLPFKVPAGVESSAIAHVMYWLCAPSPATIALRLGVVALAAFVVATGIGHARFERALRRASDAGGLANLADVADLAELGRRQLRRLDRGAVTLVIAGAATSVTLLGAMHFLIGDGDWGYVFVDLRQYHAAAHELAMTVLVLAIVIPLQLAIAIAIGRACGRESRARPSRVLAALEHGAIVAFGVAAALATFIAGARSDVGELRVSSFYTSAPHPVERMVLIAAGAACVMLVVIGLTLRARRHALARIG